MGSIHNPDIRTGFWVGEKWNEVVGPSDKL